MFTQSFSVQKAVALLALPIILIHLNGCSNRSPVAPPSLYESTSVVSPVPTGKQLGELLVRFKHSIHVGDIQEFHSFYGSKTVKMLAEIGVHVVKLPIGSNTAIILQQMISDSRVEFAELNQQVQVSPVIRPVAGPGVKPVTK